MNILSLSFFSARNCPLVSVLDVSALPASCCVCLVKLTCIARITSEFFLSRRLACRKVTLCYFFLFILYLDAITPPSNNGKQREYEMKKLRMGLMVLTTVAVLGANAQVQRTTYIEGPVKGPKVCRTNDQIQCITTLAIKLSNEIFAYVDYKTYGDVFLPILQAAAIAQDVISDMGPYSATSKDAILALVKVIDDNESVISMMLQTPAHFNTARSLMSITRRIKKQLN